MKILVLNPNGSQSVTATISESIAKLRAGTQHEIVCDYLPAAPLGIETDAHVAEVAPMVVKAVEESDADIVVVACFSDPGVALARETTKRTVIGIAEAAYYAALQHAPRFGVISLGPSSIARHAAHIERLGITSRLAGDRSMQMTVAEAADPHGAAEAVARTGTALRDEDGAGVVILGCAGMGAHRAKLQDKLGLAVIDPVQAATAAAITALDLELVMGAN